MIKKFIKRLLYGYKCSQEAYVGYLRKCGVDVGTHIEIFCPRDTFIDTLNPHLLKIGNYVSMTGPVTVLTHDYSVCVLKRWTKGEILGKQKKTVIGNNVFLGWGCCILPGTVIGDNTIIGAYAVVAGKLDGNAVYAGNPARKLCSIEEYYKKVKDNQLNEACDIYREYFKRNRKNPSKELFHEYFYLFEGGDYDKLPQLFKDKFMDHGNADETKKFFSQHNPLFSSFEEFERNARKRMG